MLRVGVAGLRHKLLVRVTPSLSSVMNTINMKIKQLVGSSRLWFQSPTALRDALGDDCRLVSSASVARLQLHGHWYISLSVTNKHELPTQQVALGEDSDVEAHPMVTAPRALVQSPHGNAHVGGSDSLPPTTTFGGHIVQAYSYTSRPIRGFRITPAPGCILW
jgi:hypothetical protein